jgi:hypothetical protein
MTASDRGVTKRERSAWQLPGIITLGLVAIGSLAFGWNASSKLDSFQHSVGAHLKASQQLLEQEMSSLRDRLAQDEKGNTDMQGELKVATDRLKITQGQLKKARLEATKQNDETMQKLSALDTSIHSELATKASSNDIKDLNTKVDAVKTDLDATRENLRSELGTLIARNHDEIHELRETLTPHFPMHPPRWTSRMKIPDALVVKDGKETLGIALGRILDALRRAQISEWALYTFESDGFAVVCRMETIGDNGIAFPPPKRWTIDPSPINGWNLSIYVHALFTALPGRYRVIVLVVTPLPLVAGSDQPKSDDLVNLLKSGAADIPPDMKGQIMKEGTRCEALVYEFYKRRPSDDARFVELSTVTPVQHLSGAMLWAASQLVE